MNRLTKDLRNQYKDYWYREDLERVCDREQIVLTELGQLEDIEDLCEKIVSQPIYEKYIDTGEIHEEDYTEYRALYNFKERTIEIYGYEFINGFKLDNYGKTWALTKEKLL